MQHILLSTSLPIGDQAVALKKHATGSGEISETWFESTSLDGVEEELRFTIDIYTKAKF